MCVLDCRRPAHRVAGCDPQETARGALRRGGVRARRSGACRIAGGRWRLPARWRARGMWFSRAARDTSRVWRSAQSSIRGTIAAMRAALRGEPLLTLPTPLNSGTDRDEPCLTNARWKSASLRRSKCHAAAYPPVVTPFRAAQDRFVLLERDGLAMLVSCVGCPFRAPLARASLSRWLPPNSISFWRRWSRWRSRRCDYYPEGAHDGTTFVFERLDARACADRHAGAAQRASTRGLSRRGRARFPRAPRLDVRRVWGKRAAPVSRAHAKSGTLKGDGPGRAVDRSGPAR